MRLIFEPLPYCFEMAERATFTIDRVIDEMDRDDLFEDDSEDDFNGYLDADFDDVQHDLEETNEGDVGELDIGEDVELGENGEDDLPDYTFTPGCTASVEGNSPLSFFSLLVTNDMLQHIVDQTNLCADQYISSHDLGPHSRVRRWAKRVHDIYELFRLLAIIVIMGIVRYPQIESHWSTLWPYSNTQFASVSVCTRINSVALGTCTCKNNMIENRGYTEKCLQVMKRDRFTLILRFLHLNDSARYRKRGEPGHDPLYKLRPFIDPLFANFQANYRLSKEICIDETMIGFKGRLSFIQYMPKKPTKWGMKAYVLADSHTGYMYNWYLYTGMSLVHQARPYLPSRVIRVCTSYDGGQSAEGRKGLAKVINIHKVHK